MRPIWLKLESFAQKTYILCTFSSDVHSLLPKDNISKKINNLIKNDHVHQIILRKIIIF